MHIKWKRMRISKTFDIQWRDIILSTIKKKIGNAQEKKNTTHGQNAKQPIIWHGFDLLVEGKKGEILPVTLLLGALWFRRSGGRGDSGVIGTADNEI